MALKSTVYMPIPHTVPHTQEGLPGLCGWRAGLCSASHLLSEELNGRQGRVHADPQLNLFLLMSYAVRWWDQGLFIS